MENIPLKVLCLEDSPRDVEIMRELLVDAGYDLNMECTAVEKEFASLLRSRAYDIILADFKLPGFDAFAALRWTKEICPNVPFICVSGSIGEETAVEILKQGAVDYILKDRLAKLPSAIERARGEAKEREARQRAEEALRESEEKFSVAFKTSPYAITITRPEDGQFIEVNDAFFAMTGFTREETLHNASIGRDLWVDEEDRIRVVKELRGSGRVVGREFKFKKKNGEIITGLFSAQLIPIKTSTYILSSINDITERKQAEEELRQSRLLLKSSIESPKEMIIFSIDKNYKYLYFNTCHKNVMARAYGKEVELGMNLLTCMGHDNDRRRAKINFDRALGGESHITIEEYGDLERYYYETRYNPILSDKNEIIGATAFSANVTEHKRTEEQIRCQLEELRRWHDVTLGREGRVRELKREINELLACQGQPPRYPSEAVITGKKGSVNGEQ